MRKSVRVNKIVVKDVTRLLIASSLVVMLALAARPASASWLDNFDSYTAGTPLDSVNAPKWTGFDGTDFMSTGQLGSIQPVTPQSLSGSNSIQGTTNGERGGMFRATDAGDDTLYFSFRFGTPGKPGSSLEVGMAQNAALGSIYKQMYSATPWVGLRVDTRAGTGADFPLDTFDIRAFAASGAEVVGSGWNLDLESPDLTQDTWYDFRIILQPGNTLDYAYKASSSDTWIESNGHFAPDDFAFNYVGVTASNGTSKLWVDNVGTTPVAPPLAGDVNFDGVVNIFDINLVSANWNGAGPTGDANHDGTVNIFDINLISSNWTPSGGTAVPEPTTLALVAVGLAINAWHLRRRIKRFIQQELSLESSM